MPNPQSMHFTMHFTRTLGKRESLPRTRKKLLEPQEEDVVNGNLGEGDNRDDHGHQPVVEPSEQIRHAELPHLRPKQVVVVAQAHEQGGGQGVRGNEALILHREARKGVQEEHLALNGE